MNIFKKDTEKHTNKLPMTGKVRKGFRIYCTAIMGAALILGTSVDVYKRQVSAQGENRGQHYPCGSCEIP